MQESLDMLSLEQFTCFAKCTFFMCSVAPYTLCSQINLKSITGENLAGLIEPPWLNLCTVGHYSHVNTFENPDPCHLLLIYPFQILLVAIFGCTRPNQHTTGCVDRICMYRTAGCYCLSLLKHFISDKLFPLQKARQLRSQEAC